MDPYLIPYKKKTQLKMDYTLKCNTPNCKTPRKTQRKSFMTLFLAMISWIGHQKHRQQKEKKKDKWDYIKQYVYILHIYMYLYIVSVHSHIRSLNNII